MINLVASLPTSEIKSSTVNSVTLEWSPPNDGGSTITAYEAGWRTFDNSYWTDISGATSPRTISGLTADTPYYFRLKATNTIGSSDYSTTEYVTVPKTFYVVSTGDVVTSYEDSNNIFYKVHTFNSSSTFTVTGTVTADIFLVGGGGGGGYLGGGGGGGGGVVYKLNEVLGTSSSSSRRSCVAGAFRGRRTRASSWWGRARGDHRPWSTCTSQRPETSRTRC